MDGRYLQNRKNYPFYGTLMDGRGSREKNHEKETIGIAAISFDSGTQICLLPVIYGMLTDRHYTGKTLNVCMYVVILHFGYAHFGHARPRFENGFHPIGISILCTYLLLSWANIYRGRTYIIYRGRISSIVAEYHLSWPNIDRSRIYITKI